jgi:hypothetical protein
MKHIRSKQAINYSSHDTESCVINQVRTTQLAIILIFELVKFSSKSRQYLQHIYRVPRQVYHDIMVIKIQNMPAWFRNDERYIANSNIGSCCYSVNGSSTFPKPPSVRNTEMAKEKCLVIFYDGLAIH